VGWNTYLAWKVELVHPHPELAMKKTSEKVIVAAVKEKSVKISETSL
jgi:hypothetical protein